MYRSHVPLLWGLFCIRVIVPLGAMRMPFKSNSPFIFKWTNSLGFNLEGRGSFKVISFCSSGRSQFFIGKSGYVDNNPVIK